MSTEGIEKFWRWWPTGRPRIEAAIAGEGFGHELVEEINEQVTAIEARLDWEFAPGIQAQHAMCVSPKGDPELRLLTETWRVSGPPADATWEFHGARQGGPTRAGLRLQIDGIDVGVDDFAVAFEVDHGRERVDGQYFHPSFATGLESNLRFTIAYLTLDGVFGEDGVERWLGTIEPVETPPSDGRTIAELATAVDELRRTATGQQFAVLRGEDSEGAPIFATVNQALKRIDHLLCCMHGAVDLKILAPDEHGLTTAAEADELNAIEDELTRALGASAVFLGRETRRGRRILHWFAPEDGPAQGTIETWASGHPSRDISTTWRRDPAWEAQRRFT